MSVSNLTSIVSTKLLTTISKSGSSSSSTASLTGSQSSEPISTTLQRGARGFAASIQYMNAGISYLTVASEYTNKMLDVVNALDALVAKASKGNISPGDARRYREDFDKYSRAYDQLVKGAVVKGRDLLSVDDMERVLKRGGLDAEKVDELSAAFSKITSFSGANTASDGSITQSRNLFAADKFYRAVSQATRDPEEPEEGDDGSGAFGAIRGAIKDVKTKVTNNIEALKVVTDLVGKNLELTRATGFAFLNTAKATDSTPDANQIVDQLRSSIRSTARGSISEVHNLEAILSAGLLALDSSESK